MNKLIKNAYVLTMDSNDSIIENGCIFVSGDKIEFVGKLSDFNYDGEYQVIDAKGNIVMPGLVNCHTHIPMTIFKGYGEGLPLDRWLNEKIWPAEAKLTEEIVYWSTLMGLIEMAKTGTTAFLDMYDMYDAVFKAVKQSGHRATFAQGIITLGRDAGEVIDKGVKIFEKYHDCGNVSAMMCAHAEYTNPAEALEKIAQKAYELGAGVHIHVSETAKEHEECKERNGGLTPIKLLDKVGMTKCHIAAAHCVYVEDEDIEIMAEKNINVLSCPQSNLKLGSGIARVRKLLDSGVNVGVATDGSSSNNNLDMIEETMLLSILQRGTLKDAVAITDMQALKIATMGSARAIGLSDSIGSLEKGKKADIIMIDTDCIEFTPRSDLVSCVVNSGSGKNVCMTMIGGNIIYKDGVVSFADEKEVISKVSEFADRILN